MEDKEIDLWELFLSVINLFRKRKVVILSFFLLGLLYSVSNFFTHPLEYKSYYKKEYIAESSVATNEILYDIINGISLTFNDSLQFRNLKAKLDVNPKQETRLKVAIEVFEKNDADSMLNSIRERIDSIETLKEKFELTKKQNQQLLSAIKRKITECDSAKKNSNYISCLELIEKKQSVEKELTLNKIVSFTEINPDYVFVSNTRTSVLNIFGYGFLGIIIGFLTGFMMNVFNGKK